MAKQIGTVKFKGTVDGFSFYHNHVHGYLVRRMGGVTAKYYRTDPRYEAARNASSEFAGVSSAGKLIRNALYSFTEPVKDGTIVNRMNKELIALKQLDSKHIRGKRSAETMIANAEANKYFRIFQFNESIKTYDIMHSFPVIVRHNNCLFMKNLSLLEPAFPKDATHAGLTMVRTVIDFEKKSFTTISSERILISKDNPEEVSLCIHELPPIKGIEIVCLQVIFFCEKDGNPVQMKGKVHSMGILEVTDYKMKSQIKRVVRPYFRKNMRIQPDIRGISQNRILNYEFNAFGPAPS